MAKVFIGIDPGLTGAVAAISAEGKFIEVYDTPILKSERRTLYDDLEMSGLISMMSLLKGVEIVGVEAQQARPGQGVSSMFKIGLGYGLWRGIIAGLRLPSVIVQPRLWVKEMSAGRDKADRVLLAKRLFPRASHQLTKSKHGRADALLIAEWVRRHSVKGTAHGKAEETSST